MHVNNETGVVTAIEKVGKLCHACNALFHCDAVQAVGKTEINLHAIFHGKCCLKFQF